MRSFLECGIYCLCRLFVYFLAMSENGKVFLEFVKRPLSSPTLFWTVIVQVLTAGTQESEKKIREIFLPSRKNSSILHFRRVILFRAAGLGALGRKEV